MSLSQDSWFLCRSWLAHFFSLSYSLSSTSSFSLFRVVSMRCFHSINDQATYAKELSWHEIKWGNWENREKSFLIWETKPAPAPMHCETIDFALGARSSFLGRILGSFSAPAAGVIGWRSWANWLIKQDGPMWIVSGLESAVSLHGFIGDVGSIETTGSFRVGTALNLNCWL